MYLMLLDCTAQEKHDLAAQRIKLSCYLVTILEYTTVLRRDLKANKVN